MAVRRARTRVAVKEAQAGMVGTETQEGTGVTAEGGAPERRVDRAALAERARLLAARGETAPMGPATTLALT